jgi:hypothetical protein
MSAVLARRRPDEPFQDEYFRFYLPKEGIVENETCSRALGHARCLDDPALLRHRRKMV